MTFQPDPLYRRDQQEAADERSAVPEYFDCDLPLEDWADRYNAAHPDPALEAELQARREQTAAALARVREVMATCDALRARTEGT